MASVNEELLDRAIRHLMFLTRLQTAEANKVLRFVERTVIPDITNRLARRMELITARGYDLGPVTTRRLEAMLASFKEINTKNFRTMKKSVTKNSLAIAKQEAQWQSGTINDVLKVSVDFDFPSTSQLRNSVLQRPFGGQKMNEWFNRLNQQTTRNLNGAVRQGMIEGDTIGQMVRRVRGTRALGFTDGIMQATRREAQTLVRTSVIHASAQGREALYKNNDSLIKNVQWISTLDRRTCPICGALDGEVFKVDEGPRPPIHPQCRCTTHPNLKTAKELGLANLDLPPATRASATGQVPAKLTYNKWLRQQANAGRTNLVKEALGKTRADLFIKGKLEVGDFVARNKTLTLKQLRKKEGAVFKRLKIKL